MSQNIRDKPKSSSSGKRGASKSDIRSFFGAKPKVVKRRSDENDESEEKPLGNQPEAEPTNLGT